MCILNNLIIWFSIVFLIDWFHDQMILLLSFFVILSYDEHNKLITVFSQDRNRKVAVITLPVEDYTSFGCNGGNNGDGGIGIWQWLQRNFVREAIVPKKCHGGHIVTTSDKKCHADGTATTID